MDSVPAPRSFDVVVIGAGIIGLTITRKLLRDSELSVALIDASVPCSGSTGAGQGYLWLVHKTPGTSTWDLASRSHMLWEMLVESIVQQGLDPSTLLGWKRNGAMLVGKTSDESEMLRKRAYQLSHAGVKTEYLSSNDLLLQEPALMIGEEGGALFCPNDCQIDPRKTATFIEEENRKFASEGRYMEFFNNGARRLIRDADGRCTVETCNGDAVCSNKAVVVAAGSWTGDLLNDLLHGSFTVPVKPRKGHLVVLEKYDDLRLNHGLMDVGYIHHEVSPSSLSVSMTATTDSSGDLLLGSSRQFSGFDGSRDESVISCILEEARAFFPCLRKASFSDLRSRMAVRVGFRPYMDDAKPVIGVIPGLDNVFVATGHEGNGLSMAMGTAEVIADMITGGQGKLDWAPFLPARLLAKGV